MMHWNDRVYGEVVLDDPDLQLLIACPTVQRLRGIRQAGPSAFAYPFKTVTRFEHSLGALTLLRRLEAPRVELVAGLLHDISHTAFSHAVDFLVDTDDEEQAHHESLKPLFLHRPDLEAALRRLGFEPEQFYDDSIYPLLEQPIPLLCADRLDYFLRDGIACGVTSPESIARTLGALVVVDNVICLSDVEVAREVVAQFAEMNRHWWSGPIEAYIYNEFADALREGFRLGVLRKNDMLVDDEHVLACLRSAKSPLIAAKLEQISRVVPDSLQHYTPRVVPKSRWLDPPVVLEGSIRRLSEIDGVPAPGDPRADARPRRNLALSATRRPAADAS
jgi:HD superfamily phosphohydrolase